MAAGAELARAATDTATRVQATAGTPPTGMDRQYWVGIARRLSTPVLEALAARRLNTDMPVEAANPRQRREVTHLEALGRLLCGIAPWLELGPDDSAEGAERRRFAELARAGIDAATDPASPDFMNFTKGGQPLVDAAFLAQAILRAPTELWSKLDARVRTNVLAAMASTRSIAAPESNWKLFATMVEALFVRAGGVRNDARLMEGIEKHARWYLGDGTYGDGPEFHWDYYNSFVIQPMFVEALDVVGDETPELKALRDKARQRLSRWAAIQERMIAPDGTFPVIGRSVAYRCGAFHGLALASLRRTLPKEVSPAQARVALTAVIRRTLEASGTWDSNGWLQIGIAGHQPRIAETYISTGSLYLASFALLPLGLAATDPFWSEPAARTTWEKIWAGEDVPADKALK